MSFELHPGPMEESKISSEGLGEPLEEERAVGSQVASQQEVEVSEVLDRLGIKHVDEDEARKNVLARAQARWAVAGGCCRSECHTIAP